MRFLWVKTGTLLPADTGGRRRTWAMLRAMSAAGHHIRYLGLKTKGETVTQAELDDPYAREKSWVSQPDLPKNSPRFFLDLARNWLASGLPWVLERYQSADWRRAIREQAGTVDVVVCDFLTPAPNFEGLELGKPVILFQHNVEARIWERLSRTATNPLKRWYFSLQHRRMVAAEKRLCARFDGVITVSTEDTAWFRDSYSLKNVLGDVPAGVDVSVFQPRNTPPPAAPVVGFLGSMDWIPNVEGVLWFVREVLPRLRRDWPGLKLKIIGRNPAAAVRDLPAADPGIEVTGTVPEVQSHAHECSVIAVPLLAGGGTRIKIFEAMAMGVPVVSTTVGAEGLPVRDGEDVRIADGADAFADAIHRLLAEPARAEQLARRARIRMETEFSWEAAAARFVAHCQCR